MSKKRIAVLDKEICIYGDTCPGICMNVCPINRMGKDCIVLGEDDKPVISEELCVGCGICPKKCPVQCISIINLTVDLKEPLHQFGINSFRVYRFPQIKKGRIIGLIGRNGIGKTTLMKVMANELIPNLGAYEEKGTWEKVLEFYKGKEIHAFFDELSRENVKISFKPQQVEMLPQIVKGKVKDLLKKVDERKKLKETVKDLELESVLESDLKDLSGGELQRVAIAATVLKNADLYLIDEGSSFLDVKQRLNMAKALNALVDENKSVIVAEHDLAVLDYLSDYIHILFGEPAVYGVVSNVKTTKNGINEYLEGFIKDENLRFRTKPIKFEVRPPIEKRFSKEPLTYPSLEKGFERFKLKVDEGVLYRKEVLGVLGPNGIGKTTFVKMLAGVEKPDEGDTGWRMKLSYKPQYLTPEKNVTVEEFFLKAKIDREFFKSNIDKKLNITKLNEKKMEELSGGELQRVAIAYALSLEAEVYLLDEPSAYLDIEQRLAAADLIRDLTQLKNVYTLVVDHDVVFMDFVSDRLIVFEGVPGKEGKALKPMSMEDGMNHFLKELNVTFRRDPESGRPRANKPDSLKDREQKEKGNYYYA